MLLNQVPILRTLHFKDQNTFEMVIVVLMGA